LIKENLAALEILDELANSPEFNYEELTLCKNNKMIVTPNLDHLRLLTKNPHLRSQYAQADIYLPDGQPVVLLLRFLYKNFSRKISRITGVDTTELVLQKAKEVFVVGSSEDVIGKILIKYTRQELASLKIESYLDQISESELEQVANQLWPILNLSAARHVLICLGFPKQEKLALILRDYRYRVPKIFYCVGGSLDMLSGEFRRAPFIFQKFGGEWVWRLCLDFNRLYPRYRSDLIFFVKFVFSLLLKWITKGKVR